MKTKSGWQEHPTTNTAHYFPIAEPGANSICNRDTFVFDGKLFEKAGIFPCSFCLKKIEKEIDEK